MINLKTFIIFAFCATVFSGTVPSFNVPICKVPIKSNTDWKPFWPLVFRTNGSLYPVSDSIENNEFGPEFDVLIPQGEEVILSCGPNYIGSQDRTQSIKIVCSNDGKLKLPDGSLKTAKDLACDLRPVEEVLVPVEGCPNIAISSKFGYIHPIDNSARIIGESCYNKDKGQTLFAHIRLGQGAPEDSISNEILDKRYFSGKEYPDSRYKVEFMKLFRLGEFNERLMNKLNIKDIPGYQMANYIDIEHLMSNKQFFAAKKLVWNYFVLHDDVVDTINAVRNDILKLSELDEIDVYIGSHGVVKLTNDNGEQVPIYLDEKQNKYPVPEVIWFVVTNGKKTATFAVFNDPSMLNDTVGKICSSKCNKISWLHNVEAANLIYKPSSLVCCEYNKMKNVFNEIPKVSGSSLYI